VVKRLHCLNFFCYNFFRIACMRIVVLQTTVFIDAELKCPMCNHVAPDIDSLQLHCNDCIEWDTLSHWTMLSDRQCSVVNTVCCYDIYEPFIEHCIECSISLSTVCFDACFDDLWLITGVQNLMKMLDISFLKTEPTSKFKNRKLSFRGSVFKKPTSAVLGRFFTLSHAQFILQHDRINSQSIFLHAASLHF